MASAGALIDYLVREQAMSDFDGEGPQGLEVRNIEILTLLVSICYNLDQMLNDLQKRGYAYQH